MGRPLRVVKPGRYYFITNRCIDGQFVMRPDDASKALILGILARAVVAHNVRVVAFVFMSNHFHLICRFPDYNMGEFMSQLTGQLSRRLNKLRGRSGTMFPERYHDQVLLGEGALKDKLQYVVNNPVKDALVADAADWPGATSIHAQMSDGKVSGEWYNGKTFNRLKQKGENPSREDALETYEFELEVPPFLEGGDETGAEGLMSVVSEHRRQIWSEFTGDPACAPDVLGAEEVKAEPWSRRAGSQRRAAWPDSQRLLCWCHERGPDSARHNANAISQFYEDLAVRTEEYHAAAAKRREGEYAEFPLGTYPPGEATAWTPERIPESALEESGECVESEDLSDFM